MSDSSVRGRFLWHELITTDTKAAGRFFSGIADWKTQAWDQNPSYVMFVAKSGPMAGLVALAEDAKTAGMRPHWLTYIGSPDAQETARQAVALGGKVIAPLTEVPPVGRWVVLQDPQGAVFAAFTPTQTPKEQAQVELGDFSWHELATTDGKAAFDFYRQLFGWQETSAMDMGPELGTYQMYGRGGAPLGGIYKKPAQSPGPPAWLPYIRVKDAKKTPAATAKGKGQVINGPMEVPGGDWITMAIDPQGAAFAVHSVKPAAKASTPRKATKARKASKPRRTSTARKASARKATKARRVTKAVATRKSGKARKGATTRKTRTARKAGARKIARTTRKTRRTSKRRR